MAALLTRYSARLPLAGAFLKNSIIVAFILWFLPVFSSFAVTPTMAQLEDFLSTEPNIFCAGCMEDRGTVRSYLASQAANNSSNTVTLWQHALEILQVRRGKRPAAFISETGVHGEDYGFEKKHPLWEELFDGHIQHIEYVDDHNSTGHLLFRSDLPLHTVDLLRKTFADPGNERNSFESYRCAEIVVREGFLLGYSAENIYVYLNKQKTKHWWGSVPMTPEEVEDYSTHPEKVIALLVSKGMERVAVQQAISEDKVIVSRARAFELYQKAEAELLASAACTR